MTTRVVFTEGAREDLRRIAEHIATDSPKRARSFVAELRSRLEAKLSAFPASGPAIGNCRYSVLGRYVAIYQTPNEQRSVRVIMVTEGHRDWRRMIEDMT
jgi:toxin ParE1/3/4